MVYKVYKVNYVGRSQNECYILYIKRYLLNSEPMKLFYQKTDKIFDVWSDTLIVATLIFLGAAAK